MNSERVARNLDVGVTASAPGKIILFGEHAVVFGEPALALAINFRTTVTVTPAKNWSVNGGSIDEPKQEYVKAAVNLSRTRSPFSINIESQIPEGSGMGSSAAVTVATLGALRPRDGDMNAEAIAREAFEVEHAVQGRASPIDTSTSAHGHAILVLRQKGAGFLWRIEKGDRSWLLHHRDTPPVTIVVGHTGIPGPTGPLVANVKAFADRSKKARDMISEIGQITLAGVDALGEGDLAKVGKLMNRNHELLNGLGVGHELLDKYVEAARPYAFGAKLTGAGGGGSMIALTEQPEKAAKAIEAAGGKAYKVMTGVAGLEAMQG